MDEPQALEALNNLLTQLAESPLDASLHVKHIQLAQETGDASAVYAARELYVDNLAAPEQIWLPWIHSKLEALDLQRAEDVEDVLSLFSRAERDYLSIPILELHIDFLIETHEKYQSAEISKPSSLGEQFSTEWTRLALQDLVESGVGHPFWGQNLWRRWCEWEMERLSEASNSEKPPLVAHVERMHLVHLKQPHSASDETFQSYSTFTTNFKPQDQYEKLLVAASKIRSGAVRAFERRQSLESSTFDPSTALTSYEHLLLSLRRASKPDVEVVCNAYERAIAEAASRRYMADPDAESSLNAFWIGYCDFARITESISTLTQLDLYRRAIRSIPACGEIWARFIRLLEKFEGLQTAPETEESIPELYNRALGTGLVEKDVDQIVPLVLARASYEKRRLESGQGDADALTDLITILENGIELVEKASSVGDPKYRLQRYLAGLYTGVLDSIDSAIALWDHTSKNHKTSYVVWTAYTDILIKAEKYDVAREVFQEVHTKYLDWPESIFESWISFENLYGSLTDLETCLDRVEKAQTNLQAKRAKEAEKAMQAYAEQQQQQQVQYQVPSSAPEVPMDVDDEQSRSERGTKRSAEDDRLPRENKKARIDPPHPSVKRDRENSTVFVADLPAEATEDDLKTLFKDCGEIREVKITSLPDGPVATVEFHDKATIPAALTKDKKRVLGKELSVHLGWQSTVYVANFPEKMDDAAMRTMFGEFGPLFDVRWPSKKFKSTRRFCYVQFTSPAAAQASLSLHGRDLDGSGHPMDVFISNPDQKKERSDQSANEKELYVAGLSKFTTQADLEKLFKTYGSLKAVRLASDDTGKCKGYAFIEFEEQKDAHAALAANNLELKRRRMAVTMVDPKARHRERPADTQNRSVRITGLPSGTQEGLLQQALEKVAAVRRVEVLGDKDEAVVELESPAEAGKLLLRSEPLIFQGIALSVKEEPQSQTQRGAPGTSSQSGMFLPRKAASRPRAGLGQARKPGIGSAVPGTSSSGPPKGQDDFRKMLGGS